MRALEPPVVQPDWSLAELKARCPGVELTLFAHFGIGSRERAGFSGSEVLHDLLRRHLVFDAQKACQKLTELAQEDWEHSLDSHALRRALQQEDILVIDARSELEFTWCRLPHSQLLSKETVDSLRQKPRPVVAVCKDGTQAPAASRVLRQMGLSASHLLGGLESWAHQEDKTFPVLFPLQEKPGHWYLLADSQTLRFRRASSLTDRGFRYFESEQLSRFDLGQQLLSCLPGLEMVISTPQSFSVRGSWTDLHSVIEHLPASVRASAEWTQGGRVTREEEERAELTRVLSEEAPKILASHKGTVVVEDYQERVLTLALGGGCAGCASAEITTQRELAASLYRAVPLLDGIKNSAEAE